MSKNFLSVQTKQSLAADRCMMTEQPSLPFGERVGVRGNPLSPWGEGRACCPERVHPSTGSGRTSRRGEGENEGENKLAQGRNLLFTRLIRGILRYTQDDIRVQKQPPILSSLWRYGAKNDARNGAKSDTGSNNTCNPTIQTCMDTDDSPGTNFPPLLIAMAGVPIGTSQWFNGLPKTLKEGFDPLLREGLEHIEKDELAKARYVLGRAADRFRAEGSKLKLAHALRLGGMIRISYIHSDNVEAVEMLGEAAEIYKSENKPLWRAGALMWNGGALANNRMFDEAIGVLSESLEIFSENRRPLELTYVLIFRSQIYAKTGHTDRAANDLGMIANVYRAAAATTKNTMEEQLFTVGEMNSLAGQAVLLQEMGRDEAAVSLLSELADRPEIDEGTKARFLLMRAESLKNLRDTHGAIESVAMAAHRFRGAGDTIGVADCHQFLGELYLNEGRYEASEAELDKALDVWSVPGQSKEMTERMAEGLQLKAEALKGQGKLIGAISAAMKANAKYSFLISILNDSFPLDRQHYNRFIEHHLGRVHTWMTVYEANRADIEEFGQNYVTNAYDNTIRCYEFVSDLMIYTEDNVKKVETLIDLALLREKGGELDKARHIMERAVKSFPRSHADYWHAKDYRSQKEKGKALMVEGRLRMMIAERSNDSEDREDQIRLAGAAFKDAVTVCNNIKDPIRKAEALEGMAEATSKLGEDDEAIKLSKEAVSIYEKKGITIKEAEARRRLAGLYRAAGDERSELAEFAFAAGKYGEVGKFFERIEILETMELLYGTLGESYHEYAERTMREIVETCREAVAEFSNHDMMESRSKARALYGLAERLSADVINTGEDHEGVTNMLTEASAIFEEKGMRHELAMSQRELGHLFTALDRSEDAVRSFSQAAEIFVSEGDLGEGADILTLAARHQAELLGREAEAKETYARVVDLRKALVEKARQEKETSLVTERGLFGMIFDQPSLSVELTGFGDALLGAGRPKEAEAAYREAMTVWKSESKRSKNIKAMAGLSKTLIRRAEEEADIERRERLFIEAGEIIEDLRGYSVVVVEREDVRDQINDIYLWPLEMELKRVRNLKIAEESGAKSEPKPVIKREIQIADGLIRRAARGNKKAIEELQRITGKRKGAFLAALRDGQDETFKKIRRVLGQGRLDKFIRDAKKVLTRGKIKRPGRKGKKPGPGK